MLLKRVKVQPPVCSAGKRGGQNSLFALIQATPMTIYSISDVWDVCLQKFISLEILLEMTFPMTLWCTVNLRATYLSDMKLDYHSLRRRLKVISLTSEQYFS